MKRNDVDEKLLKWKDIFEELIVDARTLTKDLLEGIRYAGASGVLVIALGLVLLIFSGRFFWREGPLFTAIVLLAAGSNFVTGLWNIRKFFQLRNRYTRLYRIQREMEGS